MLKIKKVLLIFALITIMISTSGITYIISSNRIKSDDTTIVELEIKVNNFKDQVKDLEGQVKDLKEQLEYEKNVNLENKQLVENQPHVENEPSTENLNKTTAMELSNRRDNLVMTEFDTDIKEFDAWDKLLNDIWAEMESTLQPASMKRLNQDRESWVQEKESQDFPTQIEMTKDRVDNLLNEYIN